MTESADKIQTIEELQKLDSPKDIVKAIRSIGEREGEEYTLVILDSKRKGFEDKRYYFRSALAVRADREFRSSNQIIKIGQEVEFQNYRITDLVKFENEDQFKKYLTDKGIRTSFGITGLYSKESNLF